MAVYDLFSKRQKRKRGEMADVYQYDDLPYRFRVQVVHIVNGLLGKLRLSGLVEQIYVNTHEILCREYGIFELARGRTEESQIVNFLVEVSDTEHALDVIEVLFGAISKFDHPGYFTRPDVSADEAIEELNARFQEHGIGYRFESGEIIRVDSQLVHAEVVKPALLLLQEKMFKGANEEFLTAHEHYRHGRYKECVNDCLKAFESVLKAICSKRKWQYDPQKDTAVRLIDICLANGLIPAYQESEFKSLRALLECGIPPIRNKKTGHGQGPNPIAIPQYLAGYALHLTAANILFLAEAEKALP